MRIGSSPQHERDVITLPQPPSAASPEVSAPGPQESSTPVTAGRRVRLDSIDLLRGLVMIFMALDHVRDYFTDVRTDPLNLAVTSVPLALTRWVTHFCAPVFVFLAGTGAYLSLSRGKSRPEVSRFLLSRGIWLVVLELTVVRLGWEFNFNYHLAFVQVIWAIGWSMIALSALIALPSRAVGALGVAMIFTHNIFDGVQAGALGAFGWPWQVLHAGGPILYARDFVLFVAYPLVPWIGVMAAGFAFGEVFTLDSSRRRRTLLVLGGGLTALFIVLRAINIYGDPDPWSPQRSGAMTVISFINCQKYPPSLLYLLMTLGPAIALLATLERWKGRAARFVTVFGRVPMFYYLIHIPFIHALALAVALLMGFDTAFIFAAPFFHPYPSAWGFGLPGVYAVWVLTIATLYPLCRSFAHFKARRKDPWLSYF